MRVNVSEIERGLGSHLIWLAIFNFCDGCPCKIDKGKGMYLTQWCEKNFDFLWVDRENMILKCHYNEQKKEVKE